MKRCTTLCTQAYQEVLKLPDLYGQSCRELKKLRTVTTCAMFAAVAVALSYLTSIQIGNYVKVGFSGIPNRLVDYLFGPVVGGCFGGVLDVLKYLLKPSGMFFPGFTFDAVLASLIYGSFFYKRPFTLPRILAAKLIVVLVCNVFFNTLWVSILYGKAFMVRLPARLIKNAIMWPIDSFILFSIGRILEASGVFRTIRAGLALK